MTYYGSRQPNRLKLYRIKKICHDEGYMLWAAYHVNQKTGACARNPFMADGSMSSLWRRLLQYHNYWKLEIVGARHALAKKDRSVRKRKRSHEISGD